MPKTRLISPGSIPNHKLLKNLQLQDNYISNDGGDEGIRISDDGKVSMTIGSGNVALEVAGDLLVSGTNKLYLNDEGGEYLFSDGTDLSIVSGRRLTFDTAGTTTIDLDVDTTTAAAIYGLRVDVDRVGDVSTGTDNTYGMRITSNSTGASGGTINTYGALIQVAADDAGGGTSKAIGLWVDNGSASAADSNYCAIFEGGNVGIGVDDPASPLEIFSTASQLKISYDASNYTDISVASDGHLELATTGTDADITLDSASDIFIDSANRYCYFQESGTTRIEFDYTTGTASNIVKIKGGTNATNYCTITTTTNGETTIATVDSDGTAGHLTLDADGDIILDADTSAIMNNSVVFERIAETFSDDTLIGSGATDDTQIDFRATNKVYLAATGAITNLNLIFPSEGSGNFQLYAAFDGDYTITNYKVYEGDLSAASNTDVVWPGGTKPDNTASGHDIYSFYWDHLRQICFGVASLAFAAP